jgi:transcriptional regulator with XRE-family HTH domain
MLLGYLLGRLPQYFVLNRKNAQIIVVFGEAIFPPANSPRCHISINCALNRILGNHMTTFAARLKTERGRLGLTQAELAELGGVHLNSQAGYERDTSSPTAEYLARVAMHGVDISYLFHGTYADTTVPQPVRELLALLIQLPPDQQASCFAMLTLFRRTGTADLPPAEKADEVWRAARLFEHFLSLSKQERILVETAAGLNRPPPVQP